MPSDKKKEEEMAKEFLVLSIGLSSKIGSSFRLLGVAKSLEKSKKIIENITETGAQRLAIVEKKAVLLRKPAIVVDEIDENIIKG